MTNTERHSAVELDELPPWDDAETLDRLAEQLSASSSTRDLEVYGLDSDKQTLVGLGPVERARRSREAWTVPDSRHLLDSQRMVDSQRLPQSEPPGPFIADDDAPPPSFRKRRVGGWLVTLPALVIALVATVVIVSNNAPVGTPNKLAAAIKVPRAPTLEVAPPEPAPVSADQLPQEEPSAAGKDEPREPATSAAQTAETLPVKLPELPTPPSVDGSSAIDANAGTLNVTSSPPANVVLDGRPLGKAPRVVRVPAGPHTLVFIHPSFGRRSVNVNVRPGATTGASAVF